MGRAFDRLAEHVAEEYEAEGYGRRRSEYIGRASAGKVARRKRAGTNASPKRRRRRAAEARRRRDGQAHVGRRRARRMRRARR